MKYAICLVATALCLDACAPLAAHPCDPGSQPVVQDALYFGTAKQSGSVADEDFAAFVRDSVSPRFPQGLTTWNAAGQWRGRDGKIVDERSQVLLLVHPGDAPSEQAVLEIIGRYKSQFQQEAVLRVKTSACASL